MHLFRLMPIVSVAIATRLLGQSAPAPSGLVPIPTRTSIGFNPLGLPANIGTIELENAVASGVTLGGVGSYIDVRDKRFTTFEFKVRYYPGDVVLRGVSVGATAGMTHFSNRVNDSRESLTAPTIGIAGDYNWLLGRSQHFLIGTGIGTKRVLASAADRDRAHVDQVVYTARLIFGVAF